jgi:lipopolysaccharide/colanic/teichoic acid biosynthesis glycosyltransferase
MRICKTIPSSRAYFQARASYLDVFVALIVPPIALWLRETTISDADFTYMAGIYWALASICSICALLAFRLQDGMKRYFSVHDALDVIKAVGFAELLICLALFNVTRLEGIPRSTLLIHGLLFAAGLVAIRAFARLLELDPQVSNQTHATSEHIIVVGSNQLASLFIKLVSAGSPAQRVVGVLDDSRATIGRAICGVPIIGAPDALSTVIDEFAVHGVEVDRVIVAGGEDLLSKPALAEVQHICAKRSIRLEYVPQMLGIGSMRSAQPELTLASSDRSVPRVSVPRYLRYRRVIDFLAAAAGMLLLSPLIVCVGALVLLDVGSPVLFWQQRLGRNGRPFLVYKFRTLQAPFDRTGWPMPEYRRESGIGYLLRKTGLDELPQLLNVLIGDMSLIGPRPLLPNDQPPNPEVRLLVRPGITGWAQVNGAKSLTPTEKDRLDEWYIRNASIWLDLRVAMLTLKYVLAGDRRAKGDLVDADPQPLPKPSPIRAREDRSRASQRVA